MTVIGFDFGPNILALEAFSNGQDDDERLYVLSLVARKESVFWGGLSNEQCHRVL